MICLVIDYLQKLLLHQHRSSQCRERSIEKNVQMWQHPNKLTKCLPTNTKKTTRDNRVDTSCVYFQLKGGFRHQMQSKLSVHHSCGHLFLLLYQAVTDASAATSNRRGCGVASLCKSGGRWRETNLQPSSLPPSLPSFPKSWLQHIRARNLHVRLRLKARLRIKRLSSHSARFFFFFPWTWSRSAEINSLIVEGTYLTLELLLN